MTQHKHDHGQTPFTIDFNGREILSFPGQSVAAVLLASGERYLRCDEFGEPKGVYCGIGYCWECRCRIDGVANVRACMTEAKPGMIVERQDGVD